VWNALDGFVVGAALVDLIFSLMGLDMQSL
jgi:hypothetical protein